MCSGFLVSVYEKSVCLLSCVPEIFGTVGDFTADLVVEGEIIVGLKAVEQLAKTHEIQLVNYLVATGLLINFGTRKVDIKRKVRRLTN